MEGAASAFTAFNEVAEYVRIVKNVAAGPRYRVVGIDGVARAWGNHVGFMLDRAHYWENYYTRKVDAANA
jgi:hypothetical protein